MKYLKKKLYMKLVLGIATVSINLSNVSVPETVWGVDDSVGLVVNLGVVFVADIYHEIKFGLDNELELVSSGISIDILNDEKHVGSMLDEPLGKKM